MTGELTRMKHRVSHQVVADLLHALGYSLQANRKTKEGTNHPDRTLRRHVISSFFLRIITYTTFLLGPIFPVDTAGHATPLYESGV